MKTLTVYTKPGCSHCVAAKDFLQRNNIAFTEIDAIQTEGVIDMLRNKGFKTMPVIYAGDRYIGGASAVTKMRKEEILELLEE